MSSFHLIKGLTKFPFTRTPLTVGTWNNCSTFNKMIKLNFLQRDITNSCQLCLKKIDENEGEKKKKKVEFISLIGTDNNLSYMTLEEATKLSNRRGLKLIKLNDYDKKRQCAVYQMLTGAQYLKDDIKSKKSKVTSNQPLGYKSEKLLSISHKISAHDLQLKINQMEKWIEKNHQVRATISGSNPNDPLCEAIFSKIDEALEGKARILQKRSNSCDIKFQVIAKKKKITKEVELSNEAEITNTL